MKTTTLLIVISLCFSNFLSAQSLELEIIHKLNKEDFTYAQPGINNLENQFTVNRLEYYLSEITVVHDGGQESTMDSLWVLVNGDNPTTTIDLSELTVTSVESIKMSVGVSPDVNNEDPSEWPSAHPLAHKEPSMHWGWTAGYRFVAMEGNAGLSADYEIHALGNGNYFQTSFEPNIDVDGNDVVLSVYADYAKAFTDIDLSSGIISHGEQGEAVTLLENFRDNVFMKEAPTDSIPGDGGGGGSGDSTNSVVDISAVRGLSIFPNPSQNGIVTMKSIANNSDLEIEVFDLTGKSIPVVPTRKNAQEIRMQFDTPGIYILQAEDVSNKTSSAHRIVILE